MRDKGFEKISDFVGNSTHRIKPWGDLDLNYKVVAEIDQQKCIHCGLCYIACEDGAHQSIRWDKIALADFVKTHGDEVVRSGGVEVLPGAGGDIVNQFTIKQDTCVGCNLCSLVCPVQQCIGMKEIDTGKPPMTWNEYQKLLAEGKIAKIEPPTHV
jgi:dihydropyrimidine dehydrogenase (NAD+) subunit PreA